MILIDKDAPAFDYYDGDDNDDDDDDDVVLGVGGNLR